ncbi:MAG: transpeptidase [Pelagibacterales bacterium]|nr:transpeptidase [Pelagibacterales bacterium]OUU61961.1 MAG: hypothetical protein CBC22_05905 [Alphaproteobacteria bacterium TMED62]|tara:strand:+ start:18020 stop:18514 length:495 start_codon:yes stop_codon:yes gene_type:complete
MITVFKNGELHFKNKIYKCALGRNGIRKEKIEGDGYTPEGEFSLGPLYYRSDRIKKFKSCHKFIPIQKNMFWSDYSNGIYYNKLLNFKDISFESLYKINSTYDLILVVNYNTKPIIKNKGSAIFLHIAKKNFSPTSGCIALKKICFIEILKKLNVSDTIKIVLN